MPSAPPNSDVVSEIAAAAPARSGGAAPITRSVANVNTGASPSEAARWRRARQPTGVSACAAQACSTAAAAASTTHRQSSPLLAELRDQQRREHRADHERERPRHRPQARPQTARGPAPVASTARRRGTRRTSRSCRVRRSPSATRNCGIAQQSQVDQRLGEQPLPAQERDAHAERPPRRRRGQPADAVFGDLLAAVDRKQYGHDRQQHARVQPARRRVLVLGQQPAARPPAAAAITGTLIRNTEPHQKCSSSSAADQRSERRADRDSSRSRRRSPSVRWRSSWNMLRISESVDGASVAPASPSSARATISIVGAGRERRQQRGDAEAAAPISSSRRRPIRSPSVPS